MVFDLPSAKIDIKRPHSRIACIFEVIIEQKIAQTIRNEPNAIFFYWLQDVRMRSNDNVGTRIYETMSEFDLIW